MLSRGLLTQRSVHPKIDRKAQNLPEKMDLETPGVRPLTPSQPPQSGG